MRVEDLNIADLVPHTGESILLDAVVGVSEESIRCSAVVRKGKRYVQSDGVGALICLEWMAQAISAYVGLEKSKSGKPVTRGYLISCRDLHLDIPWLEMGDELEISATVIRNGGGQLGSFACEVFRGEDRVAGGILNVYEGELK